MPSQNFRSTGIKTGGSNIDQACHR